jgi:glycerol-3-phosphate dehydrogenase
VAASGKAVASINQDRFNQDSKQADRQIKPLKTTHGVHIIIRSLFSDQSAKSELVEGKMIWAVPFSSHFGSFWVP